MLRSLTIKTARLFPQRVKQRIHKHPTLSRFASRLFARVASVTGSVATIETGPLKGTKLKVSEHTSHAHLSGSYELKTQLAIDRLVQPGFICYDLGASIGYLSLLMAQKAKHVYAFEPAPHAVREIRNHIEANHLPNITIIEKPVSDGEYEVTFALNDNAYGNEIVRGPTRWPTITIKTVTLDQVAREISYPDFIKIDVEGEEGRVLLGAGELLKRKRPVICCELHGNEVGKQVQEILTTLGYTLTTLDNEPFEMPEHVVPGELQIIALP